MAAVEFSSQRFESLCTLASREHWCWKMVCTTCGHMLFRYALRHLSLGADPGSSDWVVHRDHPVLRRGSALRELGPIPPLASWPIEEQRKLKEMLKTANLSSIAAGCSFPDWLGYLGLALHYTEEAELEDHALTHSWVPQLARLVPDDSPAYKMLAELEADRAKPLTWRHLEAVESDAAR